MKAIGYVRVSTAGQAEDGVSLDAQDAKVRAWCLANDCDLLAVHVDAGLSGCRADNRPALQAALDQACAERAVLVVYSLSRLARSTKDTILIGERLGRAGADLVSLSEKIDTTTAAGKMVFRMLAVLNEFERDQIAERTSSALQHLKRQGKRVGAVPFGFRLAADGESLEPDAHERQMIEVARRYHAAGMGLREIGRRLDAAGYAPRKGGEWQHKCVARLLAAEVG